MHPANTGLKRPQRPGRRERLSLVRQLLRRCFPHALVGRLLRLGKTPAQRCVVRVLLLLLILLLTLLAVLISHLMVENPTIAKLLHVTPRPSGEAKTYLPLPLESASPEAMVALKKSLKQFAPRSTGPVPRIKKNGFLSPYFDLEERAVPQLTKAALEGWEAHAAPSDDVAEDVLLQHAEPAIAATAADGADQETEEDARFFDLLAFLHPPAQQQRHYRAAMNDILGFGTRVGGTEREPLLHHLLHEGLGRSYFNARQHRYHDSTPHLSQTGKELLEKAAPSWPSSPHFAAPAAAEDVERIAGWRWSLLWDNFTTTVPKAVQPQPPSASVPLKNLVFQFPGGSQFRRKRAALAKPEDVFTGHRPNPEYNPAAYREDFFEDEHHPLDGIADLYTQENFIGRGRETLLGFYVPEVRRGEPGTRAEISTRGHPVPLKPSLSARTAAPVSRQPVQHAVYAAHWDSMLQREARFLGACDSAMPMVFLLRTIKSIAVLTDIAEALTESYKAELGGVEGVVPGLTHTFRKSTTETEVRARLGRLLSPALHALLYRYFFARPYTVGGGGSPADARPPGSHNYASEVAVDVRMWLDWVQHLPAISIVLFDAEEAFERWAGNDHTYGSRHLAQRWRDAATAAQTRYSGGPQSLFDTVDLFSLYDLMGTAGATFHNLYPTQSGIYFAALAQKEAERRAHALRYTAAITNELLWRVLGTAEAPPAVNTTTTTAPRGVSTEDAFVRQLGSPVDVAVAAVDPRYVTKVLADPSSRPSPEVLPRSWLLYGSPHEMLTLHRLSLPEFLLSNLGISVVAEGRRFDGLAPGLSKKAEFDVENYMESTNLNIFFLPGHASQLRRRGTDPVLEDDQLHWLDTQRVLHLISYPFPKSWHTEMDDGRDIHDGTSVDLANVLWSTVLELGHYWTGEEDAA